MTREHNRRDRVVSTLTRRRAIAGGATLLTAGGTVLFVSDDASASVELGSLAIPDASLTGEEVTPVVDVTAKYDYDVGTSAVAEIVVELLVGDGVIASETLVTDRTVLTNESDLAGRVTDSDAWASSDFAPAVASSVEQTLTVGLRFRVLDSDGNAIVSATTSEDVVVTVSHPQESQYVASVGGNGVVRTATDDK